MDDLIASHEARQSFVALRDIGHAMDGPKALMARNAAGALEVPPCDVHRFNFQVSGQSTLLRFNVNKISKTPPSTTRPGTVSFVPARQELRSLTAGNYFGTLQILIPRRLMRRTLEQVHGREVDDADALLAYIGVPSDRLYRLAQLFFEEFSTQKDGDVSMLEALFQALCIELVRHNTDAERSASHIKGFADEERARVLALMEQAIDGSMRLADIAEALGVEPYRLSRQFRDSFGETPRRHIMRLRLERAKRLLEDSDAPLVEIAYDCGFSSQAHMTTCFSQQIKMSPARYRAAYRLTQK